MKKMILVIVLLILVACATPGPVYENIYKPGYLTATPEPTSVPIATPEPTQSIQVLNFSPQEVVMYYDTWINIFDTFQYNDTTHTSNKEMTETRGEEYVRSTGRIDGWIISSVGSIDYVQLELVMFESDKGPNHILLEMLPEEYSTCKIERLNIGDNSLFVDCTEEEYPETSITFSYKNYYISVRYFGNSDILYPKDKLLEVATKQLEILKSYPLSENVTYQVKPLTMDNLSPNDFFVELIVIEKKCFGSAGCNVTVIPELWWTSIAQEVDLSGTLVFEIYGGDDGTLVSNIKIGGDLYWPENIRCGTKDSNVILTAKVIRILQ